MISQYISWPVFFISFIIGLLGVYLIGAEIKTIFVYPSPTNNKNIQYKDSVGQCFQFNPQVTECPMNPLSINKVPIQD